MTKKKQTLPPRSKRIRQIARERVGTVKPSRPIEERQKPREDRKPKHKRPPFEENAD